MYTLQCPHRCINRQKRGMQNGIVPTGAHAKQPKITAQTGTLKKQTTQEAHDTQHKKHPHITQVIA